MEDARRCTAKSKQSGERCKNASLRGAKTCRFHGSAAPQVKAASARRLLEELVGPALAQLRGILEDLETPPAVRLKAACDILDRMGYRAPAQVEVLTIGLVEREIARLEAELGV